MFRKLTLKGITIEEFKALFDVKKKVREKENDSLFRTAKEKKGEKVYFDKDDRKKPYKTRRDAIKASKKKVPKLT